MPLHRYRRPGRNQRCPCGSGRKYKVCHGDRRRPTASAIAAAILAQAPLPRIDLDRMTLAECEQADREISGETEE